MSSDLYKWCTSVLNMHLSGDRDVPRGQVSAFACRYGASPLMEQFLAGAIVK